MYSAVVFQEVLQKRREPWNEEHGGLPSEADNDQLSRSSKLIVLQVQETLPQELNVNHSMVIWHLKQTGKVKKLSKWVLHAAAAAAAAKSLQSCPTLCNPIDGSPPGSPIPGILQARTLEWVAISFSNAWKWKVKAKLLSHVWLFATPWTARSLPGSSIHGIFQARVLEWVAIAFSRVLHESKANKKKSSFWTMSSLSLCNNSEAFLNQIVTCDKKWTLYHNWQWPAQWLDWEEAPKHFPKPSLHQKRSWSLFGGLLPVWPTTTFWIPVKPLHLRRMVSKSVRWIKNCKVCRQYCSTERDKFFSMTIPNSTSHSQCFKGEQIGLQSFASST